MDIQATSRPEGGSWLRVAIHPKGLIIPKTPIVIGRRGVVIRLQPLVIGRQGVCHRTTADSGPAFLTHGGMNSVSEAISHEVPLLVAPQAADPFAIAGRVAELGVGRRLSPLRRSPAQLRAQVEALLADRGIRERCQRLRRAFQEAGGARRAADVIQALDRG